MPRTATPCNLSLELTEQHGSVSSQLSAALIRAIADGQLTDGDHMPSTRTLARELNMSRTVVVGAYEELVASGFLISRPGGVTRVEVGAGRAAQAGAFSSPVSASEQPPALPASPKPGVDFNLLPGFPDNSLINVRDWSRAWRRATQRAITTEASLRVNERENGQYHRFFPELSRLVAAHVRKSRGVVCDPQDVFIFPSLTVALHTLVPTITARGGTFAFEDPAYVAGRNAVEHLDEVVRPIPVDDGGIRVDELIATDKAVYVTPAHQFPMGARLSVARRTQLLEWAAQHDALVFEDDYDGEFRYDVTPMPALRSLKTGSDHVVYMGTSSKVLSRDLRIAWVIVPSRFRDAVRRKMFTTGDAVNPVAAAALAEYIESGALLRQIVSVQRTYAARRARFTEACSEILPRAILHGVHAGLHVVLTLEREIDDLAVVAELQRRGVACAALSAYYGKGAEDVLTGLVCGYSRLPETRALEAVTVLRDVLGKH